MKKLLILPTLALSMSLAAVPEAKAASCNSATAVTANLWNKYGDVLTKMGCTVAAVASEGAVDAIECIEKVGKYDESVKKMISYWNTMADTSWAKIGPRRLDMDKTHKGRIVSTGGRMFVMPAPVDRNNFYLDLKKTAGKGKTSVTVCRVGPDGSKSKVWDFIIPKGKSNIGKTWRKRLPETKGYIYTVHLDGKSATNTMSYQLSAH